MDLEHAYHDINKPLMKYKRKVWYDDNKNINELVQLAKILGFESLEICGEKDDINDIAIVKTNNSGDGLILENCHLKVNIFDYYKQMVVKDSKGNKTTFKRGEENVV